jgi:hypothetical protein
MTVDRSSRPFKIVIAAPGESIAQGLDVTAIVNHLAAAATYSIKVAFNLGQAT